MKGSVHPRGCGDGRTVHLASSGFQLLLLQCLVTTPLSHQRRSGEGEAQGAAVGRGSWATGDKGGAGGGKVAGREGGREGGGGRGADQTSPRLSALTQNGSRRYFLQVSHPTHSGVSPGFGGSSRLTSGMLLTLPPASPGPPPAAAAPPAVSLPPARPSLSVVSIEITWERAQPVHS